MALTKVTYTDNVTVIGAQNLNAIQDEIISNASAIAGKYTKPSSGVPETDLAQAVQDKLNAGGYDPPATGIPKTDLASDVQASLGKADTALQEHQSLAAYRTSAAQDVIDAGKVNTSDYAPDAKTSGMTKAVGKDTSGKLWTAPVSSEELEDATEAWSGIAYITPQMYGAVGDGTTDDTAALNALYAEASATGCNVVFPAGTYLISDTIYVTSNYDMRNDAIIKVGSIDSKSENIDSESKLLTYGILFSPSVETNRSLSGECFINIDCNNLCKTGIGSGIVARKRLNLRITDAVYCGFDDNKESNSNAENIINCFVTCSTDTHITTYGVIGTADNYYDVITTVNCTYAFKANVIGCYVNYIHCWAWSRALANIGESAGVYIEGGSLVVNYLYQDTIKYGVFMANRTARATIKMLVQNSSSGYTPYIYTNTGTSGQGEISVESFYSFLGGYAYHYTLFPNVIFRFKGVFVNNNTNFTVPSNDLNNLPDEGNFYVYFNPNYTWLNTPTLSSLSGKTCNVITFCQSYIKTQILITTKEMYMRTGRADCRVFDPQHPNMQPFQDWVCVNPHNKKLLSDEATVAANSYVDLTFSTGYADITNWQATVYCEATTNQQEISNLNAVIGSVTSSQVVVRVFNNTEQNVKFKLYLFGEQ